MPPANSKQPPGLKQKTLLGFFKTPSSNSTAPNIKVTKSANKKDAVVSLKNKSRVNADEEKGADMQKIDITSPVTSIKSSGSRASSKNAKDTPPTSDPVDVDMLFDLDGDDVRIVEKLKKRKKSVTDDSDNENDVGVDLEDRRVSAPISSPDQAKSDEASNHARTKRPRTSSPCQEDSDVETDSSIFSQKLARFKQPFPKARSQTSGRSSSSIKCITSDEEDESEKPVGKARSKSSASSTSSRPKSVSSEDHDFIASSDSEFLYAGGIDFDAVSNSDLEPKAAKSKYKPADEKQKAKRPPMKSDTGRSADGGSQTFLLTAAEQRALEKKSDKKEKEDPFSFLLDIKDKNQKRPGDPDYDPRTLYIPTSAWKNFTAFETQFWEIKQNHFDTVLFFQKGKFLELYEDDARIGNRVFDLKLTQRVKMSMVGVPEMSFNFWAAKFLAKGYKVGRVDQSETALGAEMRRTANKGKSIADKIVRRELNKVYTNGTLVDADLLIDEEAGHCVSIREDTETDTFGICVLDSATSQFDLSSFVDDVCRTKLETIMRQLRPKEIIFTKGNLSVTTTRLFKNILDGSCLWTNLRPCEGFDYEKTLEELKEMFPDDPDEIEEGNGIPNAIRDILGNRDAVEALGAMIWYLRQLNIDKDILSMKNFNIYDPMKQGQGLVLDGQTLAHIEVLVNSEGTVDGSLLKLLGRCVTPFGKRLFRLWLCMPLRDLNQIKDRQDAVQDLIDHPTFETEFGKLAKGLPDLERIVSRIHAKNCKVKEFLKVLECFKRLSDGLAALAETADSLESKSIPGLLRTAPDLTAYLENVESMFEMPENLIADELVPCEGKDEIYDQVQAEIEDWENQLSDTLKKLEKKHGMKLKYWHSAQGTKEIYQVETPASQKDIPKTWTKTGSTKVVKRWSVPELARPIRQLKEARETRNSAAKEFKYRLYAEFDTDRAVWLRAVKVMAELDCLFSLAKSSIAIGEPACRPEFVEADSAFIDFKELRHPALDITGDFIPNNVRLGGDVGRIALLTGPNMAGKSTMMRMTAAGVIMAQLGMLVPAASARLAPVDSILTRMGAYDNMFSNASTFKVELDECCKILRDATPKSLVILDELGRGTSTFDGMAIAGAVLHHLATHTLALSCFATHYSSLTDDFAYHPNIRNMHMQTMVDDEKRELLFLYKLVEGVATGSFGTHVANLAGVPLGVVTRAETISNDFARQFKEKQGGKKISCVPVVAQADFAYLFKLATGAVSLDLRVSKTKETLSILKRAVKNQPMYQV
ncbi:DNA mismatch repair protein Msh6 [Ramaria rubella]|nr:DNA mismatch repair protein Msh6 [Ramaria rubella]